MWKLRPGGFLDEDQDDAGEDVRSVLEHFGGQLRNDLVSN